jgi:predicted transcriptional regulator of viral defense system
MIKKTSATLFIIIAFKAALFANTLENQKPINKYEQTPTPSHPKNIKTKLSAKTRTNIKKVNKEI